MARDLSIGEAAAELGMTPSALRYYDRQGLLPGVSRTSGGTRRFTEDDLEWVRYVERLKLSGMPIKEVRRYVELYEQGDATIGQRRAIVEARRARVEDQLEEARRTLDFITYKCWYYEVAEAAGTCDAPRDMPWEELPPDIRRIKQQCQIRRY